MKVDKKKLMDAINRFIKAKKQELADAEAALKTYDADVAAFKQRQHDYVVGTIAGGKPKQLKADITQYGSTWKLTVQMDVKSVPKDLEEEPQNPKLKIEGGKGRYYAGKWSYGGLKEEIEQAKERLAVIQLVPGDTIDVNTKQVMATIEPYLSYV